MRAKFHQAKCSGSRVISSALDFGQLSGISACVSMCYMYVGKLMTFPRRMLCLCVNDESFTYWKRFVFFWILDISLQYSLSLYRIGRKLSQHL